MISATPLQIRDVAISQLRCHEQLQWHCSAGLNMLIGANGSGKTSLLEAVYLMAYGRSFRQARDPFLVRRGQDRFAIHGSWQRFGPMQLSVLGKRGQTSLRLQGRDVQRRKDVSESFPVLVDAPQGRKLIDGNPRERRRWLDSLVMTCFQGMHVHYERYLRAVMQRSRLLRRRILSDELDAWEHQIVRHGLPIIEYRQKLIQELNGILLSEVILTEQPLVLLLKHQAYNEADWLARLQGKRQDDMRMGHLRFGPHCDGVQMHFRDREIRSAGSRGQQKLAAIALKMAECELWRQYRRMLPVVLLDDCLEALDRQRQQRVLLRLAEQTAQVLITAPEGAHIPPGVDMNIQWLESGILNKVTNDGEHTAGQVDRINTTREYDDSGSETGMMEEAA